MISSESQDQVSGQVVIAVRRVMPLKCTRLQVSPEASAQATVNFYSIGWFLSLPSCTWGSGEWIFLHCCLPGAAALLQCASFLRGIIEWFIAAAARAAQGETNEEEDCIGHACKQHNVIMVCIECTQTNIMVMRV